MRHLVVLRWAPHGQFRPECQDCGWMSGYAPKVRAEAIAREHELKSSGEWGPEK